MGQGGNVVEMMESAFARTNSSPSELRGFRGGFWDSSALNLRSSVRDGGGPTLEDSFNGFRVASVPEPSTYALLLMTAAGVLWMTRSQR
jgi:formylglycine-generating enzyme required for sulfatase activity